MLSLSISSRGNPSLTEQWAAPRRAPTLYRVIVRTKPFTASILTTEDLGKAQAKVDELNTKAAKCGLWNPLINRPYYVIA